MRVGGALLIVLGILLLTGWWDALMIWLRAWLGARGSAHPCCEPSQKTTADTKKGHSCTRRPFSTTLLTQSSAAGSVAIGAIHPSRSTDILNASGRHPRHRTGLDGGQMAQAISDDSTLARTVIQLTS